MLTKPSAYEATATEYYDGSLHPTCRNFGSLSDQFFSRVLTSTTRKPLLEVGAGRSTACRVLSQLGTTLDGVVLLDSSAGMLEHSREFVSQGAQLLLADAEDTGLPNGHFETLVASLCDPYNSTRFWSEAFRISRAGAACYATLPSHSWASAFRADTPTAAEFLLADGSKIWAPSFVLPLREQIDLMGLSGWRVIDSGHLFGRDIPPPISPKITLSEFWQGMAVVDYFVALREP